MIESDAKRFQELFEREMGVGISLEEAEECAKSLVDMIRLIYKPIKKEGHKSVQIRPSL